MSTPFTRRDFLHRAVLGAGALALAACGRGRESDAPAGDGAAARDAATGAGAPAAGRPLGVGLYSVRGLLEKDMAGTLGALAAIGYREVEFAGYFGRPAKEVRAMLDRAALTAPTVHVPLAELRANIAKVADDAGVIGQRLVICPWLETPTTLDAWRRLADEFNGMGTALKARGLEFAYHNHDFEFAPIQGTKPYDLLAERTDPALVKLQLDLFWATKMREDPVALFARHPGRFPAVHVKDMRSLARTQGKAKLGAEADEMADVGTGEIDFGRIFARAAEGGVRHFIAEYDNPPDPLASMRTSYANLRRLLA